MATLSMPLSSAWSCCRKTPTQSLRGFRVNWQRSRLDGRLTEITGSPFWYTTVTSVATHESKNVKISKAPQGFESSYSFVSKI